jgi:myo-inositol-1-phosphate synthase
MTQFQSFDVVLTFLSYLLKAPLTQNGAPIVNALFKQQKMVTNVLLACVGLNPENEAQLEYKTRLPKAMIQAKL